MSHLNEVGLLLVRTIRTIRGQHKAGIPPSFGQIDDLFDLGERLSTELQIADPESARVACSIGDCKRVAETRLVGQPYCRRCADALDAATMQIHSDAPQLARERVAAMVAGRVPWPKAPAADETRAA